MNKLCIVLHLVGLRPRVYYTLTNFRGGGGGKAPLAPLNTPMHKETPQRSLQLLVYCARGVPMRYARARAQIHVQT